MCSLACVNWFEPRPTCASHVGPALTNVVPRGPTHCALANTATQLACGCRMDGSNWCACACQDSGAAEECAARNADEPTSPGRRDGDHLIGQWRAPNEVGAARRIAPHAIAPSCQYLNARSYWYGACTSWSLPASNLNERMTPVGREYLEPAPHHITRPGTGGPERRIRSTLIRTSETSGEAAPHRAGDAGVIG